MTRNQILARTLAQRFLPRRAQFLAPVHICFPTGTSAQAIDYDEAMTVLQRYILAGNDLDGVTMTKTASDLRIYEPGDARAHRKRSAERMNLAKAFLPHEHAFIGPLYIHFPNRPLPVLVEDYNKALKTLRNYMARENLFSLRGVKITKD